MLDREQLASASEAERERALRSERQELSRERARIARQRALRGDPTAARTLRASVVALLSEVPEPDPPCWPDAGRPGF